MRASPMIIAGANAASSFRASQPSIFKAEPPRLVLYASDTEDIPGFVGALRKCAVAVEYDAEAASAADICSLIDAAVVQNGAGGWMDGCGMDCQV